MPHRIRLRAPWKKTILREGPLSFQRGFNRPSGLSEHQDVRLRITCSSPSDLASLMDGAKVSLNGEPLSIELSETHAQSANLSPHLHGFNQLEFLLKPTFAVDTAWDEVCLVEIEIQD